MHLRPEHLQNESKAHDACSHAGAVRLAKAIVMFWAARGKRVEIDMRPTVAPISKAHMHSVWEIRSTVDPKWSSL
jgi:hypothetical protein